MHHHHNNNPISYSSSPPLIPTKKISLGQFFTTDTSWCTNEVKDFIKTSKCTVAYDPFAGGGDLLKVATSLGFKNTIGLDIDKSLLWKHNDSLLNIPHLENAIIITNPPYIAKQSASRKHLKLQKYFEKTKYDDIYLLALDRMIEAQKYIVAIVPESFINSNYDKKDMLRSISILEANPFDDTENPVCVLCFDGIKKPFDKIKVYKNEKFINNLQALIDIRLKPKKDIRIVFNDKNGWLGLRAVDSTDDKTFISFALKKDIDYDWNNKIKNTSRHITLIDIDVPNNKRSQFIKKANNEINLLRKLSSDVILTPFKGNTKKGIRRRRLDYSLARAILENIYKEVVEHRINGWVN